MRVRENLRNSLRGLAHNRLRTFLTMLGVIIGVFSVILLTSLGEGVKSQVTAQVESLGANLIYVVPGKFSFTPGHRESKLGVSQGISGPFGQVNNLTYDDLLALKSGQGVAAVTGAFQGVDRLDQLNLAVATTGVDEDFPKIRSLVFKYGRFFTGKECSAKTPVAIIGWQANLEIFHGGNSVGRSFTLNGKAYRVTGVLAYKKLEGFGPGSDDLNVKIYLPITEILARNRETSLQEVIVRATSASQVTTAEKAVRETLKKRHGKEDFSLLKQQDMLKAIDNILGILTAALGGIAAISLVVGGIGIMNIMLVSVRERTREIGVRKATGAKYRDILVQFLIEAVVLSLCGGILGLVAGIAGSGLLPELVPSLRTVISPLAVGVSLLFALLVGIFFGVYPAALAARLDPIEALRSE